MSDNELRDVMGAAAMIGGIVGSIIGSRMMTSNKSRGSIGSSLMQNAGSLIGSIVASEAATSLVKTAHEQSRDRALKDNDRRERVARGEDASTSFPADQVMKDLMRGAAGALKTKAFGAFAAAMSTGSQSGNTHTQPTRK